MAEIDKKAMEELKKVVGFDEDSEHNVKEVNIIKDKKQFSIRIPKKFSEIMKIDETKDTFEWHLIPTEENNFVLEGKLKKL